MFCRQNVSPDGRPCGWHSSRRASLPCLIGRGDASLVRRDSRSSERGRRARQPPRQIPGSRARSSVVMTRATCPGASARDLVAQRGLDGRVAEVQVHGLAVITRYGVRCSYEADPTHGWLVPVALGGCRGED
eukprot:1779837-Prymnesium_polylepis.2